MSVGSTHCVEVFWDGGWGARDASDVSTDVSLARSSRTVHAGGDAVSESTQCDLNDSGPGRRLAPLPKDFRLLLNAKQKGQKSLVSLPHYVTPHVCGRFLLRVGRREAGRGRQRPYF